MLDKKSGKTKAKRRTKIVNATPPIKRHSHQINFTPQNETISMLCPIGEKRAKTS
jgi:hypothetical protein